MKKMRRLTILILMISIMLTGCGKTELSESELTTNTVLVRKDGTMQMGIVEEFNKDYYNLDELEEYVKTQIDNYNNAKGEDCVSLEYVKKSGEKAFSTLSFNNVDSYNGFNSDQTQFYTYIQAKEQGILTGSFVMAEGGQAVSASGIKVDNEEDYYVAKVQGDYILQVEGEIVYYENATVVDKNQVQAGTQAPTVVIFK